MYSDNLIEVTEWCMSLDPLSRPQSVFALQKELARETESRYTKLSFSERLKLQIREPQSGDREQMSAPRSLRKHSPEGRSGPTLGAARR